MIICGYLWGARYIVNLGFIFNGRGVLLLNALRHALQRVRNHVLHVLPAVTLLLQYALVTFALSLSVVYLLDNGRIIDWPDKALKNKFNK